MAFQVASGNEQRMRADVSELVYRARAVSAAGRQKTFIAPLPDYLRCLPVLGPCFGNGCANCGSVEARCSPAVWGCGSLRRHRRNFAGTLTTKTRAGRSRSAVTAEISPLHSKPLLTGSMSLIACSQQSGIESANEHQVLCNSNIVISGLAPNRMGKPVMPMPRFM